ncbi:plasmid mobilization relaxosome protein MobC [Hymenobacter lapidiphilus]|uniref:plasmid mobilization protein n=1 Tax=Hymenobacter sp. CCM 8763 TaxID=2303334 RepID=UPI000E342604|nr:plasmid mobilization relaxosome protein MobC [Hymenobacter sp. CCM 8763]RFP64703.1 plasmid mobilization relaxosome protein MobC [Hymenobacter sp. CCM 8763]
MTPDQPVPAPRRRGRQPKTTPHQSHTVSVRLTEAEHQELATEAKTYRKSMGEVLRSVWAGTPDAARPPRPRTVEEVAQLRQLVGMAGNLNQLTKQLHAGHNVSEAARQVLVQLYRLLDELAPDSTR